MTLPPFPVLLPEAGHTLAKVLRSRLHEHQPSWKAVNALVTGRRVTVGDALCTDPARRLAAGELVTLRADPLHRPKAATPAGLVVRHLDDHLVVVEKPAHVNSVRHPTELEWKDKHKRLDPTLQDLAGWAVAARLNRPPRRLPPLRIVHRLDRETSGLLAFARTAAAERGLGLQFRKHTVARRYLTVVPGAFTARTIRTDLVRDRGDGRRGSTPLPRVGKPAVTHVSVEERLGGYTLLSCRLETGRTHQIRIHLSEAGHPVCGDKVYHRRADGREVPDASSAPRLALHAAELGFDHPVTGAVLHWAMPPPADLQRFLDRLRANA